MSRLKVWKEDEEVMPTPRKFSADAHDWQYSANHNISQMTDC